LNVLFGKEYKIGKYNALNFDLKGAWGGSRRYVPYTTTQVTPLYYAQNFDWDNAYEKKYPDYFRINARVGYRLNKPKYSLTCAIDFMNITNHENIFFETFDVTTGKTRTIYQFPFMPVGVIRVQF
jgi:outer membrane receptor protein involved in Fe transport